MISLWLLNNLNLLLFIHSFFSNKFSFLILCFNNLQPESEKNSQQFSQLISSLKLTSISKDISRLPLHFYLCLQFSTIHFQSEKCIFLSLSLKYWVTSSFQIFTLRHSLFLFFVLWLTLDRILLYFISIMLYKNKWHCRYRICKGMQTLMPFSAFSREESKVIFFLFLFLKCSECFYQDVNGSMLILITLTELWLFKSLCEYEIVNVNKHKMVVLNFYQILFAFIKTLTAYGHQS